MDFAMLEKRRLLVGLFPPSDRLRAGSLKDDFIWKLRNASLFVPASDAIDQISIIIQKIVLSNWLLTVSFLWRDFSSMHLEYLTDEEIPMDKVNFVLKDIDSSRSLLNRCLQMTRRNCFQLGIRPSEEAYYKTWHVSEASNEQLLQSDWSLIYQELKVWADDTERLISVRMTNLQVLDSKRSQRLSTIATESSVRSQRDSEQVNIITRLGQILLLVFTPTGIAYGILSMPDDFSPGKSKFWWFFVLATSLCSVTVSLAAIYIRWTAKLKARTIAAEAHVA